jgi:hypothetical protein
MYIGVAMNLLHNTMICIVILSLTIGTAYPTVAQTTEKADWIAEALSTIANGDYPRIKAISFWADSWEDDGFDVDLTLGSSPEALEAYRDGIASDVYVELPQFEKVGDDFILAPTEGVYHGAYTNPDGEEDGLTATQISDFETDVDKELTWVYFSNNWEGGIEFPSANVQTVVDQGALPFIRLMPRSQYDTHEENIFTLEKINAGEFDADLRQWAQDAKQADTPLLLEFGTEVNGDWFPWNAKYHGNDPQVFIDSYRHIVDLFDSEGLMNTTWFYHVDADSVPEETWNTHESYYPGDDYVDWIGMSVYGVFDPSDDWESFTELFDYGYEALSGISESKPLAILEFSVNEYGESDGILNSPSIPILLGIASMTLLRIATRKR